ncbi:MULTISPECIES: hypothetical protein [Alteromonadaceae]|uniref:hypothetical protein n=1 Tax=Alteromonadaceae TaxID=72275 RepID=UPI001C09CEDF|nr:MULTISPECIES: hypothetical protein [Aliiglaciecola]MBU2877014.1 hypothetical protein [Aliiglaciecola lipolytica]MDO6712291.1 hypothetical protein [Aliiglaciecola sp. 2_MG-2023]MDO6753303.1 hypothetical protein [Aliiglaciecola sp. 1_MG-2023]
MSNFQFVCPSHQIWVEDHPKEAFQKVNELTDYAESLFHRGQYQNVIPFLGTALETTEIIFDSRLESPQLTTKMTAIAIMLASSYSALGETDKACVFLRKIRQKLNRAIACAEGYGAKVAFFKHCETALLEANSNLVENHSYFSSMSASQLH